jgi:hypothetical protein
MAGELLFRILDRKAFAALERDGWVSSGNARTAFRDRGHWSLTQVSGESYVVVDGSAFFVEAPWLYEGHHTFAELPLGERETATLVVPREVVADWKRRLEGLAVAGQVARASPAVRDALTGLMEAVLNGDELALTVQSPL